MLKRWLDNLTTTPTTGKNAIIKNDHEEEIDDVAPPRKEEEIVFLSNDNEKDRPVYLIRRNHKRNLSFKSGTPRLISKSGRPAVHPSSRPLLGLIYTHDLANTLIHCSWKWSLLALSLAFMLTYLLFACIWMMVARSNGDLELGPELACLGGIQGFAGYMMFSIETQATIGYGSRYITHNCPEAILVLCLQMAVGTCVCGLVITIVYEKIAGPPRINGKNCFTKKAVVCLRDGELCLVFRVRDLERRYQCNNQIKVYLVQKKGTEPLLKSLKLENVGIMIWPVEVVHRITETSPFWDLSAKDLVSKRLEIIVAMEGTSLSTSNTSSTTTSYLSREILWGHTFIPCVGFDKEENQYAVNHKLFNATRETVTPLCSGRRLRQVYRDLSTSRYCNCDLSIITNSSSNNNSSSKNSPTLSTPTTVCLSSSGNSCSSPITVHHQHQEGVTVEVEVEEEINRGGVCSEEKFPQHQQRRDDHKDKVCGGSYNETPL